MQASRRRVSTGSELESSGGLRSSASAAHLETKEDRISPLSLLLALAAALCYSVLQLRAATPPGGGQWVAAHFFQDVSFALPACTTLAYLAFCLLGPRVMAARKPLSCKGAMLVYNAYQAAFNVACCAVLIHDLRAAGMKVWGNRVSGDWAQEPKYRRIVGVVWLHYNNKYLELLDSVFMVLRKKTEQLSFLHCYHHCLLIWAWLLVMKLPGCVDSYFGALCNAFIHVLMYSYYALASLGVPCPWKKLLTQAQLVQFVVVACQSLYLFFEPGVCPAALPVAQLFVMSNMLILFTRFYRKQYQKKLAAKARRAD